MKRYCKWDLQNSSNARKIQKLEFKMIFEWYASVLAELRNTSSICSTVFVFAFCLLFFKFLTFVTKQLECLDLRKSLTRCGGGLFFGSPEGTCKSLIIGYFIFANQMYCRGANVAGKIANKGPSIFDSLWKSAKNRILNIFGREKFWINFRAF